MYLQSSIIMFELSVFSKATAFKILSIIKHNYAIPQVMPHVLPLIPPFTLTEKNP